MIGLSTVFIICSYFLSLPKFDFLTFKYLINVKNFFAACFSAFILNHVYFAITKMRIIDEMTTDANIYGGFHQIAKADITVRTTDKPSKNEYLTLHNPFQSNLRIETEDPEELGLNDANPTKANVDVVINPSAVIKTPELSLL